MGNIVGLFTKRNNPRYPKPRHRQHFHLKDDIPLIPVKAAPDSKTVSNFGIDRVIFFLSGIQP